MRPAPVVPLPAPLVSLLRGVAEEGERLGLELALVGGAVRDLLLGLEPSDIDIGAGAEPEAVFSLARALGERFGRKPEVHEPFGTASLLAPVGDGQVRLDLAMRRSESYPRPAALPVVEPGTWTDDLARRDFTVNALAWPLPRPTAGLPDSDPWTLRREALLTAPDALGDLESGLLRVLHRDSFHDDPTRLFRGARLAVRFGFSFATETWELAKAAAPMTLHLSPARLGNEVRLTAQEPRALAAFAFLDQMGVWQQLLPGWGVEYPTPDPEALVEGLRLSPAAQGDAWRAALLLWLASGARGASTRESAGEWLKSLGWPSREAAPLAASLVTLRHLEEKLDAAVSVASTTSAVSPTPLDRALSGTPAAAQAALYARGDGRRRSALIRYWEPDQQSN